ncbi:predicted protein [Chaetomium globosum CBS 148.51]|uniref:Uncharacterized protein n=1 Tax=Chaetomium globosum (strain ATCC 6205 / CBS 148.51 / DSM 1962 / NBRC 6347 / NRRL 1970) TaxID=306901 RepID=Q2GRM3_CHAGB|nr:uncharacterized protein CHGG_09381 [Chaetomium globosum CBS 148.51]EAQ85367.1 predicted protein [Chaetomium globosum CBS 148.51]
MSSTQGHSNVGFRGVYESQNQRHYTQEEMDEMAKHTGENVRGFMPSMLLPTLVPDPESHPEQLTQSQQRARRRNSTGSRQKRKQAESLKKDPTLAATLHGNAPAKGAIIDKELQEEDEAALRRKSDSLPGKKY